MISIEQAMSSICRKSIKEIRIFARNRILGKDISSFGSGHSTEPSEDVVIQLLANPKLDAKKRKAVIQGWIDVYKGVRKWIDNPNSIDYVKKWRDIIVSLCRVTDIAEPSELKTCAKRLVKKLLNEKCCSQESLGASVRAYMGYVTKRDIKFLENKILTNKNIAAYGFNALLDINLKNHNASVKIENYLCDLWRLKIKDNWEINVMFLAKRAARLTNDSNLISRIFLKLNLEDLYNNGDK